MVIAPKVKNYLDEKHIRYQILQHSRTFTAMETAESRHIAGKQMIKSVIVKIDGRYVMCILTSNHRINFHKLKKITAAKEAHLATEEEINGLFPECEVGAEPPLGELFGLEVFVDREVSENDEIDFNAGTHTETVRIRYKDFARLTGSKEVNFGERI